MTAKVEYICSFEKGDFADVKGKPEIECELIRCKDCKWFYKTYTEPYCALWSRLDTELPKETDFCSWAERKKE